MIELKMEIDTEGLQDAENMQAMLGSPNLATALYNAVTLLKELYALQNAGYVIQAVKGSSVLRFKLPGG